MGNNITRIDTIFTDLDPQRIQEFYAFLDFLDEEDGNEDSDDDEMFDVLMANLNRATYSQRERLDWDKHVHQCLHDNTFNNKYRMSYEAFCNLVDLLRGDLQKVYCMSRHGGVLYTELIVAIGVRWLSGVPFSALADIFGVCTSEVYDCRNDFFTALVLNEHLEIKMPSTNDEWNQINQDFQQIAQHGLFHGVVGAMDGFFQPIVKPLPVDVADNVRAYYDGQYKTHGINVQAACDAHLRFLYFGVVSPGKTHDAQSFERAQQLHQAISNLPANRFFVADAAYPLWESLLIPFTGNLRYNAVFDTYNFYLSQVRIRIEMAFGRLTNKWRILKGHLTGSLGTIATVLYSCAVLHNYVINHDMIEGGNINGENDNLPQQQQNNFVDANAPHGMNYLPNIPEELQGDDRICNARIAILDMIQQYNITRPDHNVERNLEEEYDERLFYNP